MEKSRFIRVLDDLCKESHKYNGYRMHHFGNEHRVVCVDSILFLLILALCMHRDQCERYNQNKWYKRCIHRNSDTKLMKDEELIGLLRREGRKALRNYFGPNVTFVHCKYKVFASGLNVDDESGQFNNIFTEWIFVRYWKLRPYLSRNFVFFMDSVFSDKNRDAGTRLLEICNELPCFMGAAEDIKIVNKEDQYISVHQLPSEAWHVMSLVTKTTLHYAKNICISSLFDESYLIAIFNENKCTFLCPYSLVDSTLIAYHLANDTKSPIDAHIIREIDPSAVLETNPILGHENITLCDFLLAMTCLGFGSLPLLSQPYFNSVAELWEMVDYCIQHIQANCGFVAPSLLLVLQNEQNVEKHQVDDPEILAALYALETSETKKQSRQKSMSNKSQKHKSSVEKPQPDTEPICDVFRVEWFTKQASLVQGVDILHNRQKQMQEKYPQFDISIDMHPLDTHNVYDHPEVLHLLGEIMIWPVDPFLISSTYLHHLAIVHWLAMRLQSSTSDEQFNTLEMESEEGDEEEEEHYEQNNIHNFKHHCNKYDSTTMVSNASSSYNSSIFISDINKSPQVTFVNQSFLL